MTFELPQSPSASVRRSQFRNALDVGWEKARANARSAEGLEYDPADSRVVVRGAFRYRYLPGRAARPRSRARGQPGDLFLEHSACAFDEDDFLRRIFLTVERRGRAYGLTANRYPVVSRHFLIARDRGANEAELSQRLYGPDELADMILLLVAIGPPLRFFFNSNPASDGSVSGSSVNHWHFQCFAEDVGASGPIFDDTSAAVTIAPGVTAGRVPDWRAHHAFVDGDARSVDAAARALWSLVDSVHEIGAAYNVEIAARKDATFRALVFPRAPAADRTLPTGGLLRASFGGCELTGDLVIDDVKAFDWIAENAQAADTLTEVRYEETTRPVPGLSRIAPP